MKTWKGNQNIYFDENLDKVNEHIKFHPNYESKWTVLDYTTTIGSWHPKQLGSCNI
jgi:hypothetical protein